MVPEMCGSATLTMVVSRISMKATSVTTSAITHGLTAGFQFASSAACWVPLTSGRRSLQVDGRIDGQAERQGQPGIEPAIGDDLHRNALHDLDVVAGRVLRR